MIKLRAGKVKSLGDYSQWLHCSFSVSRSYTQPCPLLRTVIPPCRVSDFSVSPGHKSCFGQWSVSERDLHRSGRSFKHHCLCGSASCSFLGQKSNSPALGLAPPLGSQTERPRSRTVAMSCGPWTCPASEGLCLLVEVTRIGDCLLLTQSSQWRGVRMLTSVPII